MPKPPCVQCKTAEKAPGLQRCLECQEPRISPAEREKALLWRLSAIPVALQRARVPASDWPDDRRWCSGCQSFVRLTDVAKGGTRCRACAGRSAHSSMLERTYVIHGRPFTAADYAALFTAQDGRCWICRRKSTAKRLAVDHDHKSGEVRGLLCPGEFGCNFAVLGNITDLAMARRIVAYFERPPAAVTIKR